MTESYLCDPAKVDWHGEIPYSTYYQDIYWHRVGAAKEKQQVFIEPMMQLAVQTRPGEQFTVCELGFGFGLNCMLAAEQWHSKDSSCRLNLISIENQPVKPSVLKKCLQRHNFKHTSAMVKQYPPPYRGQHIIWLANNIRLLLILDEVDTALANLDAELDFWFLDGFSPSKNAAMWHPSLYSKMYSRSRPGAGVATYTAAGHVRRGLNAAGFHAKRMPGFAQKKEMLRANSPGEWRARSHQLKDVTIVGAGLAGIYCAEAFSRRDLTPRIIASGNAASHIPQLAVKAQLAVRPENRYLYSLLAYQYMKTSPGYHHTGLHWIARHKDEISRLARISDQFPNSIMSARADGSVDLREAGWLSYENLKAQLDLAIIDDQIEFLQPTDKGWQLIGGKAEYHAENVILATGYHRQLLPSELEVRAIHGQAIAVKTDAVPTIINRDVSILPTHSGCSIVSGTYDRRDSLTANLNDTRKLIDSAEEILGMELQHVESYTGIRGVSRDRLPIVGPAPDWEKLNKAGRFTDAKEHVAGLYFCTAFGSRGATHARLSSENLVAKLYREPAALDLRQQRMLSPARFYFRDRNF